VVEDAQGSRDGLPGQDERVMAALAHATGLIPMMGLVAALAVWATQRKTSRFVRFQALQASVYQFLLLAALIVGYSCCLPALLMTAMPVATSSAVLMEQGEQAVMAIFFSFPALAFGSIMLGWLVSAVYAGIGAVQTFQGHSFRYVLLGRWLENRLAPDGLNDPRDER